jgi:hypothetical protein
MRRTNFTKAVKRRSMLVILRKPSEFQALGAAIAKWTIDHASATTRKWLRYKSFWMGTVLVTNSVEQGVGPRFLSTLSVARSRD